MRHIVRYRNRKLYEPKERRFVTLSDLARTVAQGGKVEVVLSDTGEDITAKVLSRALAQSDTPVAATTDALSRLLRAGSDAAETVAGALEKVGGRTVAARVRKVAAPERLVESLSPLTRRFDDARNEFERIVGGFVGRGQLTWEEGTRLKDEMGAVFRDSLADVLGRVRDLFGRLGDSADPALAQEIADLKIRLDQLETLAADKFPGARTSRPTPTVRAAQRPRAAKPASTPAVPRTQNGRPAHATKTSRRTA
ncbi:MAG: hypothetical protein JNK60_17220 [Acidobacteria bacterium]|nr:hypothetical protein [Acidobacteriota bacterium]